MTREEAIAILKVDGCGDCTWQSLNPCVCENKECELKEALDMAISALEQQSCEDAVSREPCRTCKYGEIYNDEWCRCTYPKISGCRVKIKNGCEVELYGMMPYKEGENNAT
jgi:hypothetical protein